MYYSVHVYGNEVQLLYWEGNYEEAKQKLIDLADSVPFDPTEDQILLFKLDSSNDKQGILLFNYEDYWIEHNA